MKKYFKKLVNLPGKLYKIYNNDPPEPDARDKYLEFIECSYLFSIFNLFKRVEKVPGHIVELGVGAGRNSILFGNLLKATSQSGNCKYFGFDSFGSYTKKDLKEHKTLDPNKWKLNSLKFVEDRLANHELSDVCELIPGDIRDTIKEFLKRDDHDRFSSSGFFCRLVYVDTSAFTPSKIAIKKLYDCLSVGGIICIDQRKQGGEWRALNEFCNEKGIKPIAGENYNDVPAYIIKQ